MQVKLVSNILAANDNMAQKNREFFNDHGVVAVNLMSSPGSGKTTILERTIEKLKDEMAIGVIEGDIYTTRDAERIENKGVPVVQINTNGACHLDAGMIAGTFDDLPFDKLELLIIENVGNLVCPAEFELGEDAKAMVLSITEGNDKPSKYPLMFRQSQAVLANKTDLLPYTDFSLAALGEDLKKINPHAEIFPMSAKKGEGVEEWCAWLKALVAAKA